MNNITFTQEQKEQIKQNALAIERYIVDNIVPRISSDIRLEFGGVHYCPRTGDADSNARSSHQKGTLSFLCRLE